MNLKQAIDLVLNEAESSALGENNQSILDAVEVVRIMTANLSDLTTNRKKTE